MGRIWDFFTQDAGQAMDRAALPYLRFTQRHLLLMGAVNVLWIVLAWVIFGRTAALLLMTAASL